MSKEEQDYITSTELWLQQNSVTIEQMKTNIEFHTQEIRYHQKLQDLISIQLKIEIERAEKVKKDLEEYKNNLESARRC